MLKIVEKKAIRMTKRAGELKFVSSAGKPLVPHQMGELLAAAEGFRNIHAFEASLKNSQEALELIETKDNSSEYRLKPSFKGCWILMGGFSVHLYFTDEGLVSDIFAENAENETVASTYAFFTEAEEALMEELQVSYEDVAEWVGLHYKKNFDTESNTQRIQWINRFAENQAEARTDLDILEDLGLDIRPDSDQPGKWVWIAPTDACEISYDSKEEAIEAAWQDISGQAALNAGISPAKWNTLSRSKQINHILALAND